MKKHLDLAQERRMDSFVSFWELYRVHYCTESCYWFTRTGTELYRVYSYCTQGIFGYFNLDKYLSTVARIRINVSLSRYLYTS